MDNVKDFKNWGLSFAGCDGGDPGSPENPSTWVCGLEWGGGQDPKSLISNISKKYNAPPAGYDSWEENIKHKYIFNWRAMKLLSAINGGSVSDYKQFAEQVQPFVSGKSGYFKMNLYPIAFKDTDSDRWVSDFSSISGFEKKSDYMDWCKDKRFPVIRGWASKFKPKLIICLGKTYVDDFSQAFYDPGKDLNHEEIDGRDLKWGINNDGCLVVVLPFMLHRYGLTKDVSIQKFGVRISELLTSEISRT